MRQTAINYAAALLLTAAISLSGIFMSGQLLDSVRDSAFYRQSQIIGSIFSQEDTSLIQVATDTRARNNLFKFAGALANAYVSFEFIPYNEMQTFTAVHESLGPAIEIDSFEYHGKNLVITGSAPDETEYSEFLDRLRSHNHFAQVTGNFHTTPEGRAAFEIVLSAL